jgi:hypothetical protein
MAELWDFYEIDTFKIFLTPTKHYCSLKDVRIFSLFRQIVFSHSNHNRLFKDKHNILKIDSTNLFDTICKNNIRATFTFCYKSDGRLYLCKTYGKTYDQKCKHAYLCNKLKNICSSGIIMFDKEKRIIYIDNLSGTYIPKEKNLNYLKNDLIHTFGNLNIKILLPFNSSSEKTTWCNIMNQDHINYELCKDEPISLSPNNIIDNSSIWRYNKHKNKKQKTKKQKTKNKKNQKQKTKNKKQKTKTKLIYQVKKNRR